MLALFVIVIPLLVAISVTAMALNLKLKGPAEDRFAKVMTLACVIGVLGSGLVYVQQRRVAAQLSQTRQAVENQSAAKVYGKGEATQYENQISALNAQVTSLQQQVFKLGGSTQTSKAGAPVKQQTEQLPKIYWTVEEEGPGQVAVRFKIYGPLNIPAFLAICDKPCRATHGEIGSGSEGTQVIGTTNKMAGYIFSKPRHIPAGTEGYVLVQGGSKITDFRILADSEIPEGMR
jgi:hypothetical protein